MNNRYSRHYTYNPVPDFPQNVGFYADLFGAAVRANRAHMGITQEQLAGIIGCSRMTISRAENCHPVSIDIFFRLCVYFDMDVFVFGVTTERFTDAEAVAMAEDGADDFEEEDGLPF